MRKDEVARGPHGRALVVDSITQLDAGDAAAIVVSGSHGGISSGEFALAVPLRLVFFNDAGVGKDGAGIAAISRVPRFWSRRKPSIIGVHSDIPRENSE